MLLIYKIDTVRAIVVSEIIFLPFFKVTIMEGSIAINYMIYKNTIFEKFCIIHDNYLLTMPLNLMAMHVANASNHYFGYSLKLIRIPIQGLPFKHNLISLIVITVDKDLHLA